MTTRTDLHRPSAIVPEDYRFVACDYYGPYGGLSMAGERAALRADMERTGGKYAQHENGGTCHICGAAALYVAKFHHAKTNVYITTGMDCATKLEMGDSRAFKSLRKRVADVRKAQKGKAKAEAILADAGLSAAWALYTATETAGWRKQEEIVVDVVGKLVKYGSISDAQVGLIRKLLAGIAERPARDAAIAAQRAEQAATSQHVGTVGERRKFDLTVNRVFRGEGHFGPYVIVNCTDSAGNVVVYKGSSDLGVEAGEQVSLTATVKAHDAWQGIAQTTVSRPKVAAPVGPVVVLPPAGADSDSYESESHR